LRVPAALAVALVSSSASIALSLTACEESSTHAVDATPASDARAHDGAGDAGLDDASDGMPDAVADATIDAPIDAAPDALLDAYVPPDAPPT
jgi:hypothetical protein